MLNYFKELLKTLQAIEARLAKIEENTGRVAKCVKEGHPPVHKILEQLGVDNTVRND
jgi:hypothetical protein